MFACWKNVLRIGGLSRTICGFLFIQFHFVSCSAIMSDGYMTVDEFLNLAKRRRNTYQSSTRRGYDVDHVVELQLVVAAAEDTACYSRAGWPGELVDFFNAERNLKERPRAENLAKGQAIRRIILIKRNGQNQPMQPGDAMYKKEVREKWKNMKGHLDGQFEMFKKRMDELLS